MPRVVKFLLMGVVSILVIAVAGAAAAVWLGARKMERVVDVRVVPVAYTKDAAALKLGKYLFESRGCAECHGADGRGKVFLDTKDLYVRSANLTRGKASAVANYTEADWVRAIRHGVDPQGRPLLIMPSEDYNRINDSDFAALVAYIRSLPAADGEPAQVRFSTFLKALYGLGAIPDAAERIDHKLPPSAPVPVAVNAEHGAYVAKMCMGCHGEHFAGGPIPGAPPEWPPAANLTRAEGSAMKRYDTPEKFIDMMRTGKRPDGSEVNKAMPFETLKMMNDVDLRAMHAFLVTLPPHKGGR